MPDEQSAAPIAPSSSAAGDLDIALGLSDEAVERPVPVYESASGPSQTV